MNTLRINPPRYARAEELSAFLRAKIQATGSPFLARAANSILVERHMDFVH